MHKGDPVMQKVNESQIKVQDVYVLPGFEGDPQQSDDHWLPNQKQNNVDQRQNNYNYIFINAGICKQASRVRFLETFFIITLVFGTETQITS